MTDFMKDIKKRNLPPVVPLGMTKDKWAQHRQEIIDLFSREVYGYTPPLPHNLCARPISHDPDAWAGKAHHHNISLELSISQGKFAFPVDIVLPKCEEELPMIIYISFEQYPCGLFCPIEEIVDNNYALAVINYNSVTSDEDDNFVSGIANKYCRADDDGSMWGKISMWAWAASRVMDYAKTLSCIDHNRIFVVGHSRLGKAALWCAAQDTRFAGAGVNNSGCSGIAINRGKEGEQIADIVRVFPYWFCKNYHKYADKDFDMLFEQSMLAAAIAPRLLAVSTAKEDTWADPKSEYISLVEADAAYNLLGVSGLDAPLDVMPQAGTRYTNGNIAFDLRTGAHFLSRHDWIFYMDYFRKYFAK